MKLIRDRTPGLLPGSTRKVANQDEYAMLLRMKVMEEAAEVATSMSREEMIAEMGDICDALDALATVYNISDDDISAAIRYKHHLKGGFAGGTVLMHDPLSNR